MTMTTWVEFVLFSYGDYVHVLSLSLWSCLLFTRCFLGWHPGGLPRFLFLSFYGLLLWVGNLLGFHRIDYNAWGSSPILA
ncbi:hypothetical protein ASPSYDRAFT_1055585 [Aspergillus sydowii CBS 593.65]|uniref:Uncharacterized protein n=1 Tax=Aspergillus sydowii CBS 593.65 TaxID=1036612 RepID=A0A1L9TDJ3_9EURO|nr:uncharacterized protein ASPSYDRAFT_1055585 [Aspergillus sydowii CBS 593.65]OJJ57465.1 hypothetical protein ASPSYDRAFT_1055585 [Aspergillus sydowii CBS 593.65]